jgi:LmbE family N-acetylglucosaminyl deacetylase
VAGTPDQVIAALRVVLETCRPSILMLWGNDGKVGHPDAMRCIELTGQEVLPALREMGDELGLFDPIALDTPVSLAYTPPDQLTGATRSNA